METALVAPPKAQSDLKTLNEQEQADLLACEETIGRGLRSFVEVGMALVKIRDQQLYRRKFSSFELYCRQRWGLSRIHAHRCIDAAKVHELLPIGNRPANEAQARPLTRLRLEGGELDERAITRVWQKAVDRAPEDAAGRKLVTGELVEEAARPVLQRRGIRVRRITRSYRRPAATTDVAVEPEPAAGKSISGEVLEQLKGHVEKLSELLTVETLPPQVRTAIEAVCDIVLDGSSSGKEF